LRKTSFSIVKFIMSSSINRLYLYLIT